MRYFREEEEIEDNSCENLKGYMGKRTWKMTSRYILKAIRKKYIQIGTKEDAYSNEEEEMESNGKENLSSTSTFSWL